MGYMGLSSVGESDMAADLCCNCSESLQKIFNKALKDVHENQWNTDPIVNVALTLEELRKTYIFQSMDEWINNKFLPKFEKYIKQQSKIPLEEWSDIDNKRWHLRNYRRMCRNIKKALEWN